MQEGNSFIPWYNFPLIDFLSGYMQPNMKIFEFGAGFSTLFYASNGCVVNAVETNPEWIENITQFGKKAEISHLFKIKHTPPHKLASSILIENTVFDIIIIDSYHRLECLQSAISVYKKGLIILDNSERQNLQSADGIASGFQCKVFEGSGVNRKGTSQAKVFWKTL